MPADTLENVCQPSVFCHRSWTLRLVCRTQRRASTDQLIGAMMIGETGFHSQSDKDVGPRNKTIKLSLVIVSAPSPVLFQTNSLK